MDEPPIFKLKKLNIKTLLLWSSFTCIIPFSHASIYEYQGDVGDLIEADFKYPHFFWIDPSAIVTSYIPGGINPISSDVLLTVNYTGDEIPYFVSGGYLNQAGIVSNNQVVIKSGSVSHLINGGSIVQSLVTKDNRENNYDPTYIQDPSKSTSINIELEQHFIVQNNSVYINAIPINTKTINGGTLVQDIETGEHFRSLSHDLLNLDKSTNTSIYISKAQNLTVKNNSVVIDGAELDGVEFIKGGHLLQSIRTGNSYASTIFNNTPSSIQLSAGNSSIFSDDIVLLSNENNSIRITNVDYIDVDALYGGLIETHWNTGSAGLGALPLYETELSAYTGSSIVMAKGISMQSIKNDLYISLEEKFNIHMLYGGMLHLDISSGGLVSKNLVIDSLIESSIYSDVGSDARILLNNSMIAANGNQISVKTKEVESNDEQLLGEIIGGNIYSIIRMGAQFSQNTSGITLNNSNINTRIDYSMNHIMQIENSLIESSYNIVNLQNIKLHDEETSTIYGIISGGFITMELTAGALVGGAVHNAQGVNSQINTNADYSISMSNTKVYANNNTVVIDGGYIMESVYGGGIDLSLGPKWRNSQQSVTAGNITVGDGDLAHLNAKAYANVNASNMVISANSNSILWGKNTVGNGEAIGGEVSLTLTAGKAIGGIISIGEQAPIYADAEATIDLSNTLIEANNNVIVLQGTSEGSIIGGRIDVALYEGDAQYANGESTGNNSITYDNLKLYAINNTINLEKTASTGPEEYNWGGGILLGGELHMAKKPVNEWFEDVKDNAIFYDTFSGNTLNVASKNNLYFEKVGNFENYNFTLTPELANNEMPIINADTIYLGNNEKNQSGYDENNPISSNISVKRIHSSDHILSEGDEFVLMKAGKDQLLGEGNAGKEKVEQAQQGISLIYDVITTVEKDKDRVITKVTKLSGKSSHVTANPELKSLGEGRLAMSQLLLRGADNLATNMWGVIQEQKALKNFIPFANFYAGHSKYSSDASIRANEYLVTAGAAYRFDKFTIVPLIEMGWSDYKADSHYGMGRNLHGSGDNRYYGVGLLWRYDTENGFYMDGGLRVGRASNKYHNNDLVNAAGEKAEYDFSSTYMGAHATVGYVAKLDDINSFDISTQLLWTKLKGKDLRVAGDLIDFGNLNSTRWRVGLQWNHVKNDHFNFRAGIAYEYEFQQETNIKAFRYFKADELSLKGSSMILNIGATLKPSDRSRWFYDIDVMGYAGKRKGAAVKLKMSYHF